MGQHTPERLAQQEAPFIQYSDSEKGEPQPLEAVGPLVTWTVYDANGRALASGLDRETAHLFSAAPLLLKALREAIEHIPARGRPVLLRQAKEALRAATGDPT